MSTGTRGSIAILTSGYSVSGGVRTVTDWLRGQIDGSGYGVEVYDVDSSASSSLGRRISKPRSWLSNPKIVRDPIDTAVHKVGTTFSEFEPCRYLPSRALSQRLDQHDLIQVVCGGPALALKTVNSNRPVVLQMATRVSWEREALLQYSSGFAGAARRVSTYATSAMEVRAMRCADAVLVENADTLLRLGRLGVSNLRLAPPGVDTDFYTPLPASFDADSAPIVYFGRLGDPRKGLSRLVCAYIEASEVAAELPELIIAGRGRLDKDTCNLIEASRGRLSITVQQDLTREESLHLLRRAGVFVQASFEEGLGIALIEAMACGTPSIATRTSGTSETVAQGLTGFLIGQEEFNGRSFLEAYRIIIKDRRVFSRNARLRAVNYFSDAATFGRFESIYQSLIGR